MLMKNIYTLWSVWSFLLGVAYSLTNWIFYSFFGNWYKKRNMYELIEIESNDLATNVFPHDSACTYFFFSVHVKFPILDFWRTLQNNQGTHFNDLYWPKAITAQWSFWPWDENTYLQLLGHLRVSLTFFWKMCE